MKLAETRCKHNPSGEQTRARSGPRTCSIIAFPLCLSDEHMFTQSLSLLSFCLSSLSLSRARAHSLSETDTSTQCLSLSRSRTQSTHTCTHAKTSSMAPFPERHCLHSSRSRCLTDQLICGVNQQPSRPFSSFPIFSPAIGFLSILGELVATEYMQTPLQLSLVFLYHCKRRGRKKVGN